MTTGASLSRPQAITERGRRLVRRVHPIVAGAVAALVLAGYRVITRRGAVSVT
jgi:hypothetical protein